VKVARFLATAVVIALVLLTSCQGKPGPAPAQPQAAADPEEVIRNALAKLGPEDRLLAEQQKFCPVMPEIRLGEMGVPYRTVVNGTPMIVCCKNCVEQAKEDPENVLAKLKYLKVSQRHDTNNQVHPPATK
jgi:hypothetical protein